MARPATIGDVLEALADPIVVADERRDIVVANLAARQAFSADLVGRNIALSIRHPDVLEILDAVLADALDRQIEVNLAGRVTRTFKVRAAAIEDGQGRLVLIAFHDTAATRQAERMRADFVANVSHELRSPLTSLLGFVETLRGAARDDPAAQERFLEVMSGEARRMARLIDDLLSLSRVEAEEHLAPKGRVDAAGLLDEIVGSLEVRAKERDMHIEIHRAETPAPVLGDRDELNLVFRNLLDNAISYGRAGTTVQVETTALHRVAESQSPGLAIAIRDRGEGIAAEHIPRLTERFYRVDKGRSRAVGGTGLGLAIVKHIVSRHRGRLIIESVPGEGSVFTVHLPCVGK